MTKSALPRARRTLMIRTPTSAPAKPPRSNTKPNLTSTFPNRKWAAAPEDDPATIWQESEAAATVGGIPIIIRMGVSKNPPLTPNIPERKPTIAPTPTRIGSGMLIPATGRSIHIMASQPQIHAWPSYSGGGRSRRLHRATRRRFHIIATSADAHGRDRSLGADHIGHFEPAQTCAPGAYKRMTIRP